MDFGGGRVSNGYNNSINVNSRLMASFSDTAMVVIGTWNQNISLRVSPFKGVNADGIRQYEQDLSNIVKITINLENGTTLSEGAKRVVLPAFAEGKAASVSVINGYGDKKKVLTIGTEDKKTYFAVAVNVDDKNATSEGNVLKHYFNNTDMYKDFVYTTGNGEVEQVPSEFINFIKCLDGVFDLLPIHEHSQVYNTQVRNSYQNRGNNNAAFGGNGGGNFQSHQMGGGPVYQAPANSFTDFMES